MTLFLVPALPRNVYSRGFQMALLELEMRYIVRPVFQHQRLNARKRYTRVFPFPNSQVVISYVSSTISSIFSLTFFRFPVNRFECVSYEPGCVLKGQLPFCGEWQKQQTAILLSAGSINLHYDMVAQDIVTR